ncbi:HET-domain-containing protein [Mollisia scopiformis]|uniref:HET-domain-containing protein n=1 Tax=Mollisia scopiformis TaxID=149040 RepID=A0A194WZR9_MOLSC|nr:HET-domain-containing protein [Mollisia scopiformis]KUJ13441.1 HET-domain-containing protein [Mollisia scopiformis]
MSATCQASANFLAFNDEDIKAIRNNTTTKKVLERDIDIRLDCEVLLETTQFRNGTLQVKNWRTGATVLCGECDFCTLLLDGLQREFSSTTCEWGVERILGKEGEKIWFQLNKVEFGRLPSSFLNGWENLESRGVSVLIFRGWGTCLGESSNMARFDVEVTFEFFTDRVDPFIELLNIYRRSLESTPLSESNVAKIKNWINDCDENHQNCWSDDSTSNEDSMPYFLPTRLLSIGKEGGNVRLVPTSFLKADPKTAEKISYVALSYCWGSAETAGGSLLMTTHQTMKSRLQRIEINTMPQAFKDAITVAHKLRIQYLWIDSLCIIQDDPPDWQKESSNMAEIFSNAYLTIAAAQGSSCNDTFLSRELLQVEIPFQIRSDEFEEKDCVLGLRFRRPNTDKMSEINQSRWVTRGWTFQEDCLARRVLIFGEKKLLFSCRTVERVEDIDAQKTRPHWVDNVLDTSTGRNTASTKRSEYDHWRDLCRHYTRRFLTCPEDKLPAISGMASLMAKRREAEYLAGLWKSDLEHDLFWYPTRSVESVRIYRAPSWSWASLDGALAWFDSRTCSQNSCQMHCTILDVGTIPLGLDPLGAVSDGFLKVSGRLLKIDVAWTDDPNKYRWRLDFAGKEVARAIPDDPTRSDQSKIIRRQSFWALLFATCQGDKQRPRGILLKETGRQRENWDEFQRVGIFKVLYGPASNERTAIDAWLRMEERTIIIV